MRSDLEDAMAAVITSREASARFLEQPEEFAGDYSLNPAELVVLMEMSDDLSSLTSSFVNKRRSALRWNARRTIELLGDEGEALLDEFVESSPMPEQFYDDAAEFGEHVIRATQACDDDDTEDLMIAAMARFEQHRSRSFWDATGSTETSLQTPGVPGSVRLAVGANIGHFDWDLRLPYRYDVSPLELLPRDPCDLLFFHSGSSAMLRTLRLRPGEAVVVKAMPPGEDIPLARLRSVGAPAVDVDRLCRRLSWDGAVQCP